MRGLIDQKEQPIRSVCHRVDLKVDRRGHELAGRLSEEAVFQVGNCEKVADGRRRISASAGRTCLARGGLIPFPTCPGKWGGDGRPALGPLHSVKPATPAARTVRLLSSLGTNPELMPKSPPIARKWREFATEARADRGRRFPLNHTVSGTLLSLLATRLTSRRSLVRDLVS